MIQAVLLSRPVKIEEIQRATKSCGSIKSYEACLLVNQYDGIVEDLINILTAFLIDVWPKNKGLYRKLFKESIEEDLKSFKINYNNLIEKIIEKSEVVVAVVTKKFHESEKCLEMIKYSKRLNKPIFGLMIENVEIQEIDICCELYKERIYPDGYDDYILFGELFEQFLKQIKASLKTELPKLVSFNN
jgi:hypothetical protein